jgi:hypothetical protein
VSEFLPAVVVGAVGVVLLVLLVLALVRHVRRFARARTDLRDDVRTAVAQLRELAYVRGKRHPHGVDSA